MLTCGGKISNPLVILKLFGKRFMADNLKILRILFLKKNYTWYVRVQIGDSSTTQTIIDLENPENGYYADPFLFEFENEIYASISSIIRFFSQTSINSVPHSIFPVNLFVYSQQAFMTRSKRRLPADL